MEDFDRIKDITRFQKVRKLNQIKIPYLDVRYNNFINDLYDENENIKFSDLKLIFKDLKIYLINVDML